MPVRPSGPLVSARSLIDQGLKDHRLRAFVYDRTSSDPHKRKSSNRDQNLDLLDFCRQQNWDITGEFSDSDLSASRRATKPRPDWNDMLRRARNGECDVIVYWESSRGTRDLRVFLDLRYLCEEKGILLCYSGDVYDMRRRADRKRATEDAMLAENGADEISDRALRNKRRSAERGDPVGTIPFGFRREYDPRTGHLIGQFVDTTNAPIVVWMIEQIIARQSLREICGSLQLRDVPTPQGAEMWKAATIRRIVLNPAVAGLRKHQGEIVGKANWPAIVDEATWRVACGILTDPGRRTQHGVQVKHLLSGIAHGQCGVELRPKKGNSSRGPSYTCADCYCCAIRTDLLDRYVEAALLAYIERPEFVSALRLSNRSASAREAVMELEGLEATLVEARKFVGEKRLSVASLAALEAQLAPQIEAAQALVRDTSVVPLVTSVAGPSAREVWAALGITQRRALIREVVDVRLNRARKRGVQSIEEDRIKLDWQL